MNFPEGHLPGKKRTAYYEERAKGGVGMIIMEGSSVIANYYPYDYALNIHENGALSAYQNIAAVIKKLSRTINRTIKPLRRSGR